MAVTAATAPLTAEVAAAAPTAITVTTTVDVLDDGDGLTSLREAVALANATPGDTEIVLAHATYALSICGPGGAGPAANDAGDLNLARADALGPAVTIAGNGATVVQTCTGVAHLHDDRTTAGSSLTITDATFTGATDVQTDAVSIGTAAALTLDGVTVTDNSAAPIVWEPDEGAPLTGAVVHTGPGSLTIDDSTVSATRHAAGISANGTGGTVAIHGTVVHDNDGNQIGAGIVVVERDGAATITDSTITDNGTNGLVVPDGPPLAPLVEYNTETRTRWGGVIVDGDLTARGLHVEGNVGTWNGGIAADGLQLSDSVVRRNAGGVSGGVSFGTTSLIERTTIEWNSAGAIGGGVWARLCWLPIDACPDPSIVRDSTIAANVSDIGGGMYVAGNGTFVGDLGLRLERTTVSENLAYTGAGVTATDLNHPVELDDTTIAGNHAAFWRGAPGEPVAGLSVARTILGSPDVPRLVMRRSVVAEADANIAACDLAADAAVSAGGNVDDDGTCGLDEASDLSGVGDVGLGPLADNGGPTLTRLPAPGSPLLDRAVGTCGPADQRGLPRPQGPACDTGAVERPLGGFHPMPPTRILDSRDGTGGWTTPLGPGETRPLTIAGLPAGTAAVVANITVTDTTAASHLSTGPDPATIAGVSTLNWRTGQTVANSTTIPVGPGDTIAVRNNTGTTQVIIDLVGTYDDGHLGCPCGDGATMTTPTRIIDTRDGTGGSATPFGPGVARTIATGLDPGARTAIVNLTAVAPSADTHLTAWAAGPVPATSNLNLPAGDTRANLAIVPLAPDGTFRLRNNTGTTHVVIDLIGSYGDGGWRFRPVTPTRTLDTRPAGFATTPTLVPMPTLPTGTRAAVTNLTGIFPTTATHLTMWAAGTTTTPTSNLNLPAGDVRANQVITRIDPDHPAATLANASGTTNAAVDLIGYLG